MVLDNKVSALPSDLWNREQDVWEGLVSDRQFLFPWSPTLEPSSHILPSMKTFTKFFPLLNMKNL